jgi:hypothetical protein
VNGEIPGGVVLLFFVFVFDVGRGEFLRGLGVRSEGYVGLG